MSTQIKVTVSILEGETQVTQVTRREDGVLCALLGIRIEDIASALAREAAAEIRVNSALGKTNQK